MSYSRRRKIRGEDRGWRERGIENSLLTGVWRRETCACLGFTVRVVLVGCLYGKMYVFVCVGCDCKVLQNSLNVRKTLAEKGTDNQASKRELASWRLESSWTGSNFC